jgi:hypothetical protein
MQMRELQMKEDKTKDGRKCPECDNYLVPVAGHSMGMLHAFCFVCKMCPDCEEGAV